MGAGADAGATKGVLGDAGTAGDSERGGMADGSARVPEVLAPAEFEGLLAGVMGPELLEPALCAPVGEDAWRRPPGSGAPWCALRPGGACRAGHA